MLAKYRVRFHRAVRLCCRRQAYVRQSEQGILGLMSSVDGRGVAQVGQRFGAGGGVGVGQRSLQVAHVAQVFVVVGMAGSGQLQRVRRFWMARSLAWPCVGGR